MILVFDFEGSSFGLIMRLGHQTAPPATRPPQRIKGILDDHSLLFRKQWFRGARGRYNATTNQIFQSSKGAPSRTAPQRHFVRTFRTFISNHVQYFI